MAGIYLGKGSVSDLCRLCPSHRGAASAAGRATGGALAVAL
eukprot:COSAG05_NODE_8_length_40675_cov_148.837539_33_plen_41_part_00